MAQEEVVKGSFYMGSFHICMPKLSSVILAPALFPAAQVYQEAAHSKVGRMPRGPCETS